MNQERNDRNVGAAIEKQWRDVQHRVMDLLQEMVANQSNAINSTSAPSKLELEKLVRHEVMRTESYA